MSACDWIVDAELAEDIGYLIEPSALRPFRLNLPRRSGITAYHDEVITNARIKRYLFKDVIQVANDDIFPMGDYELLNYMNPRKQIHEHRTGKKGEAADPERSLAESKRRAKSKVRDIALCNAFTHMFTWTLDPALVDRYDADAVYKKVRAFLSNATQRYCFRYICIPEHHKLKDGEDNPAIHFHGLCMLGDVQIVRSQFKDGNPRIDEHGRPVFNMLNWSLGWSTCVPLDENYEKAVNYITKYITKQESKIFGKWYLSSRFIEKAPDIIPVERVPFHEFRDEQKLDSGEQFESNIYFDVKIVSEEILRCSV